MDEKPAPLLSEEVEIEIIDEKYDVTDFKSYELELIEFLIDDALDNQRKNISVTFLWFYQNKLVSYISLLTDRISLEGDLREYFRGEGIYYKTLPALKIGRLCVDDRFLRRGLGKLMVGFAVDKAKEITKNKAGCRFVTVDAKEGSIDLYKKLGFEPLQEKSGTTLPLYLDILKPQL